MKQCVSQLQRTITVELKEFNHCANKSQSESFYATQVVAIATDRLTDCTVIADLHKAAARGVPVYIILNQRSIQENFTLSRLRHPVSRLSLTMNPQQTSNWTPVRR